MDKFHQYLNERMDELDADLPDDAVWERIQSDAKPKGKLRRMTVGKWSVAAACVAIIVAGTWLTVLQKEQRPAQRASVRITTPVPASTNEDPGKDSASSDMEKTLVIVKSRPVTTPAGKTISVQPGQQMDLLQKVGADYAALISLQIQKVRTTPVYAECSDYFSGFRQQLEQMDKDELAIREDMKRYGLEDLLVGQLIDIYDQKLKLLKELQNQISKMNKRIDPAGEFANRTDTCYINI